MAEKYNIRKDGYSRAIAGDSSGGICAFNAAWQSRTSSAACCRGSAASPASSGIPASWTAATCIPFKIRKEPKRNIRVWLQDGAEDLENDHGSWPLQNIQMANSLKMKDYDFHLQLGQRYAQPQRRACGTGGRDDLALAGL